MSPPTTRTGVYVFAGDSEPQHLGASSVADEPQYVYEVKPEGRVRLDQKGSWLSLSCESAVVVSCVHVPSGRSTLNADIVVTKITPPCPWSIVDRSAGLTDTLLAATKQASHVNIRHRPIQCSQPIKCPLKVVGE